MLFFNLFFSLWLYNFSDHTSLYNYLYNLSYGCMFILSGLVSINYFFKDKINSSVYFFMTLASFSFFGAQLSWFIYNYYLKTSIPYPGIPDLFFFGFYLFTTIAGFIGLKKLNITRKMSTFFDMTILTIVFLTLMYSFIGSSFSIDNSSILATVADFGYPLFDSILLAITLTAIRSKAGSLVPTLIYFIFGFIFLAFADTLFAYQISIETYWNGNFVDAFFAIFSFFYALAVIELPILFHSSQDNAFTQKNLNL